MRPPCEVVVNTILPNVRAWIVRILINEYDMRQVDVADLLEITQASVSQYLNLGRGRDELLIDMFPEIESYARETAKSIMKGCNVDGNSPDNPWEPICDICRKVYYNPKFSGYSEQQAQMNECKIFRK